MRKADQRIRQNYYCLVDLAVKLLPFRNVYFYSKSAYINRRENFPLLVAQNPEFFIFARNRISFELQSNGNIVRLASVVLAEVLYSARFQTHDQTLNIMLEDARIKFLNPDENVRRESLERLWDAWERIKTVLKPNDKKESMTIQYYMTSD